jgi:hypothetical protein
MAFAEHFPLSDLITNGQHPEIENTPPDDLIPNGEKISAKAEQALAIWSKIPGFKSTKASYGFRCTALNTACGSTSTTSAHLEFLGVDLLVFGITLRQAFDALRLDPDFMKDVDQLIIERGCIHIGLATKIRPNAPRHQLRLDKTINGIRTYPLWAIWPAEGSD